MRRPSAAFSLIEIILVLGLIAFAGSIVIANFASMVERGDTLTTEETLHAAVREARFLAASERAITTLRFDKNTGSLIIASAHSETEPFPLNADFARSASGQITFYLVPPAEGLAPFPEAARARTETVEVKFGPDRSSSPFVVEIDTGHGSHERLVFDPFSSLLRSTE